MLAFVRISIKPQSGGRSQCGEAIKRRGDDLTPCPPLHLGEGEPYGKRTIDGQRLVSNFQRGRRLQSQLGTPIEQAVISSAKMLTSRTITSSSAAPTIRLIEVGWKASAPSDVRSGLGKRLSRKATGAASTMR